MDNHDAINHPKHYTSHPSGVECIEVTRHMTFNIGNVIKYCWRSGLKDGNPNVQDLRKAAWYLNDEIRRLEGKPEHVLDMAPGEGIATIRQGGFDGDGNWVGGFNPGVSHPGLNEAPIYSTEEVEGDKRFQFINIAHDDPQYHNKVKAHLDELARKINDAVNSVPTDSEALWHTQGQDGTLTGESLDAIEAELKKLASKIEIVDGKPYYLGAPSLVHEVGEEWNLVRVWDPHSVVRWNGRLWEMITNIPYTTVAPDRSAYWTLLSEPAVEETVIEEVPDEWDEKRSWEPGSVIRWKGRMWIMRSKFKQSYTLSPGRSVCWKPLLSDAE